MNNSNSVKRVVVLGASGFLGSAMIRHLAALGHDVVAYSKQPIVTSVKYSNVKSIIADLRDTWSLTDAVKDADVVYHFASSTHPSLFYSNPSAEYSEALNPLLNLMSIAANVGVKKIVFPSSGGTIYADSDAPRSEDSLTNPTSPYAIFKLAAEQLLHHAARSGHFSVDVFRLGNPYGPGQRVRPGQGVLPHWINAIKSKQPIKVFGDGSARRDYVYIDDVCKLMSLSLDRLENSQTFNLGTGIATSLSELLFHIRALLNEQPKIVFLEGRASDVKSIALSPVRLLGLCPDFSFTPLSVGVRRTLESHGGESKAEF